MSAAVRVAAVSVLVAITPADAKPMRTGMRSSFGMYLTFVLLTVEILPPCCAVVRALQRAQPLGLREVGMWYAGYTGGCCVWDSSPLHSLFTDVTTRSLAVSAARLWTAAGLVPAVS